MAGRKKTPRTDPKPRKSAAKAPKAPAKAAKKATKAIKAAAKPRQAAKKAARGEKSLLQRSGFLATAQGEAKTVIYIHGIGNKPPAEVLRRQWDNALFGRGMGERTRMAYWVNRERYPSPEEGGLEDRDQGPVLNQAEQRVLSALGIEPAVRDLGKLADALADSETERLMLHRMLDELELSAPQPGTPAAKGIGGLINRALLKVISAALLQDVHDFFFVEARRKAMKESLKQRLDAGGGPFVVIAHSQGSMIAYDVLRELKAEQYDIALFVTVGSPLGLPAVRSMFRDWTKKKKLEFPACVRRWVNVADGLDPVALDEDLSDDIDKPGQRFVNIGEPRINPDWRSNPHSGSGYLSIPQVRTEVRNAVGVGFDQPVSNTVLIKDLSDQLEARSAEYRHEVLIELDKLASGGNRGDVRDALLERIRGLAAQSTGLKGEKLDDAIELEDSLQRFVSARLTRFELETLRNDYRSLNFKRLWRDAGKRALVNQSRSVIHADAAQASYRALGQRIGWAVLDTGIAAGHPHFYENGKQDRVVTQWDCTERGKPRKLVRGDGEAFEKLDGNGHGTHVAGIIAGACRAAIPGPDGQADVEFAGMAPETQLYGFKVLDNDGNGRDSWIIKAVQQVAEVNDHAGELVIHGVNLSLGGYFDVESYGCGFTPLCNELRRLWRQGVVVVLAAGNEGLAWVMRSDGESYPMNMDMTIGDPANLEEAIAVGSVHKSNPHSYGVSYFSSRGPTADGRIKPDVVAPGEKIISAHFDFKIADPRTWMVEMSGTSMAAPHVSGLVAAFLSARREFIGFPDRVKQIVRHHAVDIGRDRYMQGCGIPNLAQMLSAT
jgi:subtilisin family serine protease